VALGEPFVAVMPEGVEHLAGGEDGAGGREPFVAVMPEGVEH